MCLWMYGGQWRHQVGFSITLQFTVWDRVTLLHVWDRVSPCMWRQQSAGPADQPPGLSSLHLSAAVTAAWHCAQLLTHGLESNASCLWSKHVSNTYCSPVFPRVYSLQHRLLDFISRSDLIHLYTCCKNALHPCNTLERRWLWVSDKTELIKDVRSLAEMHAQKTPNVIQKAINVVTDSIKFHSSYQKIYTKYLLQGLERWLCS